MKSLRQENQAISPLEKCPHPLAKLTFEFDKSFHFYRKVNYLKQTEVAVLLEARLDEDPNIFN